MKPKTANPRTVALLAAIDEVAALIKRSPRTVTKECGHGGVLYDRLKANGRVWPETEEEIRAALARIKAEHEAKVQARADRLAAEAEARAAEAEERAAQARKEAAEARAAAEASNTEAAPSAA